MRNDFLNDLGERLSNRGLNFSQVEKVLKPYEIHFKERKLQGKTYEEIINELEPIDEIVNEFAPKKPIVKEINKYEINEEYENYEQKKRNGFVVALEIIIFALLNVLVFIPIGILIFVIPIALFLFPIGLMIMSVGALIYGEVFINGHIMMLNLLTRITLPVAIIGLSILILIASIYVFKYFFKLVASFSRFQLRILRRQ